MPRKILPDNLKLGALTAALLVAGAGLPALADPPADEKPLEGSFDQPLGKDGQESAGQSKTVMSTSDGSNNYKIEISGNKIKAWHNDKPVAKDRIRKTKDKVELLDANGGVMQTFELGGFPTGGLPRFGGGSGGNGGSGGGDQNGRFFLRVPGGGGGGGAVVGPDTPQPRQDVVIQNAPPVMVGITMSDADEDALSELSDDDFESGIVIDRVVEGLPADKAGIKPHDIIIEIAGQRPANQEKLREILGESKAGDELVIKVLRDRKVTERKIRLEKFDPSKLGMSGQADDEGHGQGHGDIELHNLPDVLKMYGEGGKQQWEEARKAIEKAMRDLEQNENLKPDKIRGQAQKALEQAMKALADAEKQGQMQWKSFMGGGEGGSPRTWMWSDKPGQLYAVPQPPSTPRGEGGGDTSRKLDRLSEQLDRLNRRLDELERRLDSRPRERNP